MDIELPGISGIETTFQLKEKFEEIDIIMFTVFEDDERLFESIQVGATGYLLKDTAIDEVVSSLKEVREGGSPITPSIANAVGWNCSSKTIRRFSIPTAHRVTLSKPISSGCFFTALPMSCSTP